MIFTIITVHKGKFSSLLKTIYSVDCQSKKPSKHFVIAKNLTKNQKKKIKKKYRKFIINKDISIYNAMNLGLKKTINHYILFLNSGDQLIDMNIIKYLFKIIKFSKKCFIFKTQIIFKHINFNPKNSFFFSQNYLAHPSFIRPPVLKKTHQLFKFNEDFKIISDGIWMKKNTSQFGSIKINKILSKHFVGGISSVPSLTLAFEKSKISFKEFIKEIIKIILYQFLNKDIFYKFIYYSKFDTK